MIKAFLAAILTLTSAGCGNALLTKDTSAIDPAVTQCVSGTAQIAVRDGSVQALCGCAESSAQATTTLTCTVTGATVIVFHYLPGGALKHQIIPTNGSFAPSVISDPRTERVLQDYAVQLTAVGTYGFKDSFDPAVSGSIVIK